jgi:hypothetical protein
MSGAAGESPPAEQAARISLRLVLKPGVILTKRGLQLRPMIARLGDDVPAYQALWADRDAFKAAIQHLLHRRCPLCEGESGCRCSGSDQRSVIPPAIPIMRLVHLVCNQSWGDEEGEMPG